MYDHVPRLVRFEEVCAALADGRDPLSVLPAEVATVLREAPSPRVLTDFAGRDSVAAAMAWMEAHEVGTLIPVGDVVPTRYGEWSVYEDNWRAMRDQVASRFPRVVMAPWFVLEDVDAWRFLNGRYLNELVRSFGFFTPCLGCHLHFYAMRAVLAKALTAQALISGEKEWHGRRKRKANQTPEAVAAYQRFSEEHGVAHHFPIHQVADEAEMERLLGDGWREGERQLHCVMSGNDQGFDGNPVMSPSQIAAYMNDFAVPLAARIVALREQMVGGADLHLEVDADARRLLAQRTS